MTDFNLLSEQTGAIIAAVLAIVFGIQKALNMWKKGTVDQSKTEAEKSVIDALHNEFKRISAELEESRELQKQMNDMIHQQAVKLTRMEMLMIRMYNLLTHNNIKIPDDLREDMVELINQPYNTAVPFDDLPPNLTPK